jgi:hypothetical protein
MEGKSVKIGAWIHNQRNCKLKEYKMLESIVREQGEAKNYKT